MNNSHSSSLSPLTSREVTPNSDVGQSCETPLHISLQASVSSPGALTQEACSLENIPTTNNPRPFAAQMGDKAEYWADGNGDLLILKFPARLNAHGMYTRIGPYFSLPDSGVSSPTYINCNIKQDH